MTALSQAQFEELMEDVPEDGFKDLVPLLMEAFAQKEEYDLTRIEVAVLVERLLGMADTIEQQVTYIGELQEQLEEAKAFKEKIWTPDQK